jgi:ABC-type multidrug transport system fused ATPase/permease subunit
MDHGRIAATGRHEELLAKSDLYRSLYELQFHHSEGPTPSVTV